MEANSQWIGPLGLGRVIGQGVKGTAGRGPDEVEVGVPGSAWRLGRGWGPEHTTRAIHDGNDPQLARRRPW